MKIEIPVRLRAIVRARESSLIVLAAMVGAIGGIVVVTMAAGVDLLHTLFFGLAPGERLSERTLVDPLRALSVPVLGGLVFGFTWAAVARRHGRREVDPIEANALRGGRMSLRGSLIVALQTVWSSGVGASVGLEAGYTQLASGIASRLGQAFRLRRSDLRILVGCGAAGAIAGAFGAPLAGNSNRPSRGEKIGRYLTAFSRSRPPARPNVDRLCASEGHAKLCIGRVKF